MKVIFRKVITNMTFREYGKYVLLSLLSGMLFFLSIACNQSAHKTPDGSNQSFFLNSKPYTRYWWFASEIKEEDVKYNLDWLKSHGFGGVELAWVYLPTEDAWNAGVMPKEKQFIWTWGYYEMRYVYFPQELDGYNPTWINGEFLENATVVDGRLKVGNADYKALYVNSNYVDYKVIKRQCSELAYP
jgi:hypothetical protein